jgi:spore coat polysaccharide biosynthesis protein SpsF
LDQAWKKATEKHEREHVMPYLYDVPGRFKVLQLNYTEDLGKMRWTLDTPEDLKLLEQVYQRFSGRNDFSWLEVLEIYKGHPELSEINRSVEAKQVDHVDERSKLKL